MNNNSSIQNSNVSDRISTVGGKQKFFDFRDGLVPAYTKDYAMLHGGGGSKFAPSSVIRLTITDYSMGTGQSSVTVQANVLPSLVEILRDKAEANMGMAYVPVQGGAWAAVFKTMKTISVISNRVRLIGSGLRTFLVGCRDAAALAVKGGSGTDIWTAIGAAASRGTTAMSDPKGGQGGQEQAAGPVMELPMVYDYHYEQTRVNTHKRSQSNPNLVSVSVLKIVRSGYRNTGDVAKLPWSITISNFYAAEHKYPNGTSSYDPKTVDNNSKREAFFTMSDEDMFRAASRVCHYIQVFEMAVCLPIVKEGRKAMEQERMANRASQSAPAYGQQTGTYGASGAQQRPSYQGQGGSQQPNGNRASQGQQQFSSPHVVPSNQGAPVYPAQGNAANYRY